MGEITVDRIARYTALIEREEETLSELFQRMTSGEGLPAICKAKDIPYGRMLNWLMADADRYALYCRALEVQAHELISETVQIADDADDAALAKLRTDVRFRIAKHHAPERYGEGLVEGAVREVKVTVVAVAGNVEVHTGSTIGTGDTHVGTDSP